MQESPSDLSVIERGLVKIETTPKEILSDHKAYCSRTVEKRTKQAVLGYITPVKKLY